MIISLRSSQIIIEKAFKLKINEHMAMTHFCNAIKECGVDVSEVPLSECDFNSVVK